MLRRARKTTALKDMETPPWTDGPLDPAQAVRIEAEHSGFFYQNLYAVGCLLLAPSSGTRAVRVEVEEDIDVYGDDVVAYVQAKKRNRPLQRVDVADALDRFARLRREHVEGHSRAYRPSTSSPTRSRARP